MFTGIIEDLGILKKIETEKGNINLYFKSKLTQELKIDQSLSHNGVCLTVVSIDNDIYKVTAVKETLKKSNLGELKVDSVVNLERAMKSNARLDGHYVQGHVDQIGKCLNVTETDGSWHYEFEYDKTSNNLTIEKGSIAVNGVSLTVVNSKLDGFSVAIIPYTYNNTNFKKIKKGDSVNIEFDMIGKYISKLLSNR